MMMMNPRQTTDTFLRFSLVSYTMKKSSFGDERKKATGALKLIAHSTCSFSPHLICNSFLELQNSWKRTFLLHLRSIARSTRVCKAHATVCLLHLLPGTFKRESFLPAETWVLWVFFSLWLIGKPAYTPSEQTTVCREEGNQCIASHLSADFFISCN